VPDQPPDPSDRQPTPAPAAAEKFGPLTLQRLVKEDGRALILFNRNEPSGDDAA
jgi:hypothetical protein